jgi:hypothetical protein
MGIVSVVAFCSTNLFATVVNSFVTSSTSLECVAAGIIYLFVYHLLLASVLCKCLSRRPPCLRRLINVIQTVPTPHHLLEDIS